MLIRIPAPPTRIKSEIEIVPPEDLVRSGGAEAELKLLFTKSNRIFIQDIFVQPFSETVTPAVLDKLAHNVTEEVKNHWRGLPEFRVVTSRLSCVPELGCKFTWLRAAFELGHKDHADIRPIACKLYPESRQDTVKIASSFEITGDLTINFAKALGKRSGTKEHEQRQYNVNAYGAFSSRPSWDFQKTDVNPEVMGDFTLLMVVASPHGVQSVGQMSVSAQVELRSGSIIPLVMRRESKNAAALTFTI
jgi:hypothetical protein